MVLPRLYPIAACAFTIVLSIVIHEAGHAIAGWATGGRITEVVIAGLPPHVRIEGTASAAERAARAVAGSAFFLGTWALALLLLPAAARLVRETATAMAIIESTGWLLSSMLYPHGPRGEDAWKFLAASGVDERVVMVVCLAITALAAAALGGSYRKIFRGVRPVSAVSAGINSTGTVPAPKAAGGRIVYEKDSRLFAEDSPRGRTRGRAAGGADAG